MRQFRITTSVSVIDMVKIALQETSDGIVIGDKVDVSIKLKKGTNSGVLTLDVKDGYPDLTAVEIFWLGYMTHECQISLFG